MVALCALLRHVFILLRLPRLIFAIFGFLDVIFMSVR